MHAPVDYLYSKDCSEYGSDNNPKTAKTEFWSRTLQALDRISSTSGRTGKYTAIVIGNSLRNSRRTQPCRAAKFLGHTPATLLNFRDFTE
ncbi:hypothetical protein SUGI_1113960 [Cryptomeria japonica]|nr:hypothetical protein SUGI_1113960 [Cryptomeria japonica]